MNEEKKEIISFNEQHEKIIKAQAKVGLYLYEFCQALAKMKESKAYLYAGYETFEEYTLNALNIKKSQAYTYVKLAETYSKEFFQSTGNIGVTKLELLTKLKEDEAKAFINENNICDMNVKSLKRTIATYQDLKVSKKISDEPDSVVIQIVRDSYPITSFGTFVRYKRLDKGFSLTSLAKLLGVSIQCLNNLESGRAGLSFKKQNFYDDLIKVLELSKEEAKEMYYWKDEEFITRKVLDPELKKYVSSNKLINEVLRTALNSKVSDDKLNKILKLLQTV